MVNRETGTGAHTSLMINASQRVIYDPAGTFQTDGQVFHFSTLSPEPAPDGSLVLDEALAESWLSQARGIPGWDEGRDYAPHPIAVSPVDEDEEF